MSISATEKAHGEFINHSFMLTDSAILKDTEENREIMRAKLAALSASFEAFERQPVGALLTQ